MSIWSYNQFLRDQIALRKAVWSIDCLFCGCPLRQCPERLPFYSFGQEKSRLVRYCPTCGWWTAVAETEYSPGEIERFGAVGVLFEFNVPSSEGPLLEVRRYLAEKPGGRFQIDPKRFEDVVASVYRAAGFHARVVGKSGDGGIDVVLDGTSETIGIQVKRQRGRISAEQIRMLSGALLISGMTRGVFVTTSDFTAPAKRTAELSALRGIPIDLVNWERFYDALGLAQRTVDDQPIDRKAACAIAPLTLLQRYHYPPDIPRSWIDRDSLLSDSSLRMRKDWRTLE